MNSPDREAAQPEEPIRALPRPAWEPSEADVMGLALRSLDRFRAAAFERGDRRTSLRKRTAGLAALDEGDEVENEGGYQPPPGVKFWGSGPGKSRRNPKRLSSVGDKLLERLGLTSGVALARVASSWSRIVGSTIAEHTRVETFENTVLVIRADSTAWATQLRVLTPQILRKIEESAGQGVVTTLQILGPAAPSWKHGPRSVRGRGPRDTYG
ncbi:MAG: DciA family protein [Buchananella hordeovulneris]|nr:DciA family protein [Buchananella hordeovulneris]